MSRYTAAISLPVSASEAFAYHERPGALQRLIPPWKSVSIEHSDGSLKPGSNVILRMNIGPIPTRWVAEHVDYDPPHLFGDVQRSGPFASWQHQHRFEPVGEESCLLRDEIEYQLPAAPVGPMLGGGIARKEIEAMFAYRHRVTRDDLQLAANHPTSAMQIAVSGSSGLVGRKLCTLLRLLGHKVIRLERSLSPAESTHNGDAEKDGGMDVVAPWSSPDQAQRLSGIDAVVHLAGKPIADKRWTDSIKKQIRDSRIDLTRRLATSLASLPQPPKVMICASAVGLYGDRGDEVLTESSTAGDGFLADVAQQWESACDPARQAGIRVVNARLGMVLDPDGGALAEMLTPAKFCAGALGDGKQWVSWVAVDDVIGSIYHAICCDNINGPMNVTAPQALTGTEFAKTLANVLDRVALIPAPAFVLRMALGEMADALLLSSAHAVPEVLTQSGYEFRFANAGDALRYCLGKDRLGGM
ncbi:TIGR01777 family oxidoreductase [Stieleria sp. TO1_6]|uniref:TIGR01777 family oxidoreductase n=1 Tax=Stieleria tagensis TaxID=2956795 RepID=UPI00209AB025|nr:TIGR01777 family oxidoreductase [Stieleria tagensis]MCO8124430.1 TIGR01777 family oxidoreductase [Stieleria tagensis]